MSFVVYGNWLVLWPEIDVHRLSGAVRKRFAVQCLVRMHSLFAVGKVRCSVFSAVHPPLVVEGSAQEREKLGNRSKKYLASYT